MKKEEKEQLLVLTSAVGALAVIMSSEDVIDQIVEYAPELADDMKAFRELGDSIAQRVADKARALVGLPEGG